MSGFVGYDDAGALVLRGRRDGSGIRVVMMNFVLQSALGQPYFLIRQPEPSGVHVNLAFHLLAPDGSNVGDLHFRMNQASLEIPGQLPLTTNGSMFAWHGYDVQQGSVTLASISFTGHPFSMTGADLHLALGPLGRALPRRRWVLALVAWATLFSPPWEKMTTR